MKLTKTTWLILTIALSVIALTVLGFIRANQLKEQAMVSEELSVAENRLSNIQIEPLSARQQELEIRLDQSTTALEATKNILSQPAESIATSDTLFRLAETHSVNITDFSSTALSTTDLAGVKCVVLPFRMRAEGDLSNLISFIFTLNNDFVTGTVESVEIGISENFTSTDSLANIRLRVYTYTGD